MASRRAIADDPDDKPEELILESLRASLQQIREGKVHPSLNFGMALMSEDASQLQVLFSDEFKDRLRTLVKRYRHLQSDL